MYIVEIKKGVFKIILGIKTDVDFLQKLILTQTVLRKYGKETEENRLFIKKKKVSEHVMFRNNSSTGRRETLSIYA